MSTSPPSSASPACGWPTRSSVLCHVFAFPRKPCSPRSFLTLLLLVPFLDHAESTSSFSPPPNQTATPKPKLLPAHRVHHQQRTSGSKLRPHPYTNPDPRKKGATIILLLVFRLTTTLTLIAAWRNNRHAPSAITLELYTGHPQRRVASACALADHPCVCTLRGSVPPVRATRSKLPCTESCRQCKSIWLCNTRTHTPSRAYIRAREERVQRGSSG